MSARGEAFAEKLGHAMVVEISMMEDDARAKAKWASGNKATTTIQRNLLEEETGSIRLNAWVSSRRSAVQTVQNVKSDRKIQWKSLDDLQTGICDGMTYQDIEKKMPDLYKQREMDKFNYRYPRGESYADIVKRLEPVIFELERQRMPVLVVSHRAILRCLKAYFIGHSPKVSLLASASVHPCRQNYHCFLPPSPLPLSPLPSRPSLPPYRHCPQHPLHCHHSRLAFVFSYHVYPLFSFIPV